MRRRCSWVSAAARMRQARRLARRRTWATSRSIVLMPGSRILLPLSQAVARSMSRLGRSSPAQHKA